MNANTNGHVPELLEFTVTEVEDAAARFIDRAPRGVDPALWAAREAIRDLRRRRTAALQAQKEDAQIQATYIEAKQKQKKKENQ